MLRTIALFFGLVSFAWCENTLTHRERKEGFELLFDGKSLAKWHSIKEHEDAGYWNGHKGVITWEKGGSWLATEDTYYDFVLRLEYRTGFDSRSGILLRAGKSGDPAVSGMGLAIVSDAGKPPD